MSIDGVSRKVKPALPLVIPDVSGLSQREAAHAYLDAGLMPHPWRVAVQNGHKTKVSCYRDFSFDTVQETHESIELWKPAWQCGLVTSRGSGLIAGDIDDLRKFEQWDFMDFPPTALATTGHKGGLHLLYDARSIAGNGSWPTQGNIPGGQVKSNGFIAVEPSIHPNGTPYKWKRVRNVLPIGKLGPALAAYRAASNGSGSVSRLVGPERTAGLWKAVLEAGDGDQHDALVKWVWDAHMRGLEDEEILNLLELAASTGKLRSFRDKWTRPGFRELLAPAGKRPVSRARADELDGIGKPQVSVEDEEAFWNARPVLSHIRGWARARFASPWATFGECLAEAVCHTPPALRLPALVGGEGTLNMLIALVGKSGAGKNAATQAALAAFKWNGVPGLIPSKIPRTPLGSGEGIPKNYGYTFLNKDTGRTELGRTEYSSIITIPEIDTFAAINSRSGSTLSPELRKFYSGEDLGFGWSDPSKRVIIPAHDYRGCVISGVQPGKGEAILGDMDGGFAQRWLFFPAHDPSAVNIDYDDPEVLEWWPPDSCGEQKYVMKVCETARSEIRENRIAELRGEGEAIDSHSLYTRLKVAAGLALLDGRDGVEESDWELSGVVMEKSGDTRESVAVHLRQKAAEENVARGKAEGKRAEAAQTAQHRAALTRIGRNVVKKMPPAGGWISTSKLRKSMSSRDSGLLEEVLIWLVDNGTLDCEDFMYQGRPGVRYRKTKR